MSQNPLARSDISEIIRQRRLAMKEAGWVLVNHDSPGVYIRGTGFAVGGINWRYTSEAILRLLDEVTADEAK